VNSFQYNKVVKPKFASISESKRKTTMSDKLNFIISQEDKGAVLVKLMTVFTCIYAANRIFEISDSVEDIDKAMKWGFNWTYGPFETCDFIGIDKFISLAKEYKCKIPKWLDNKDLLKVNTFYIVENSLKKVWNPIENKYCPIDTGTNNVLSFSILKHDEKNIVKKLNVSNIIDIGDNIVVCEFNTKLNSIDFEVLTDIEQTIDFCEANNYKGLILYNEGVNFSVGMNLWLVYMGIQAKQWDQIDSMCKKYQDLCVRLKYSPIVTVAAPFNLTLGGGAELSMWCKTMEAHVELYMGLVEVAVGLIPGAGGNIEMMSRVLENIPKDKKIPLDIVLSKSLENVAMAKVATSAHECKEFAFLGQNDGITINKDLHLTSAKLAAMRLLNSGFNNVKRRVFSLPGEHAFSNFKLMLYSMYEGGYISNYDYTVALKVAYLMSGGNCNAQSPVEEQALLDLEREAFLSLCGEKKTMDRIEHMLKNKKPLRN
jgi:3-hydroxyacyl-CoA dehydrogenase